MRTHCARGHELTDDNVYMGSDRRKRCRTCRRAASHNYAIKAGFKDKNDPPNLKKGGWNKGEIVTLNLMVSEGKSTDAIATALNRSRVSVQGRISREKMSEEKRKALALKKMEWVRNNRSGQHNYKYIVAASTASSRPSTELIEEAKRRSLAPHRSLAAALLGDPPLGFSALDRRQAAC